MGAMSDSIDIQLERSRAEPMALYRPRDWPNDTADIRAHVRTYTNLVTLDRYPWFMGKRRFLALYRRVE